MLTDELLEHAQRVMNTADDDTADLIDILWAEAQSQEDKVNAQEGIIDFWRAKNDTAEMRFKKIQEQLIIDGNMTAVEYLMYEKIDTILNEKPHELSNPVQLPQAEMVLALILDKESGSNRKIDILIDHTTPQEILEVIINQSWATIVDKSTSPTTESEANVTLQLHSGTTISFPLDKGADHYKNYLKMVISRIIAESDMVEGS